MILLDLLEMMSDSSNIVVTRRKHEIARYDGKNSIPANLNNAPIFSITDIDKVVFVEVRQQKGEKSPFLMPTYLTKWQKYGIIYT